MEHQLQIVANERIRWKSKWVTPEMTPKFGEDLFFNMLNPGQPPLDKVVEILDNFFSSSGGIAADEVGKYAVSDNIPEKLPFLGKVVHVENPSLFYIIPADAKSIECFNPPGSSDAGARKTKTKPDVDVTPYSGIQGFLNMAQDLTYTLSKFDPEPSVLAPRRRFEIGEPVAFLAEFKASDKEAKLFPGKGPKWVRAIIRNRYKVVHDTAVVNIVKYKIHLMDYGIEVRPQTRGLLRPLPVEFLDFPPMAYRCSLFGPQSSSRSDELEWDKEACAEFLRLVDNKMLDIKVEKRYKGIDDLRYDVHLMTIAEDEGKPKNIAEELAAVGHVGRYEDSSSSDEAGCLSESEHSDISECLNEKLLILQRDEKPFFDDSDD